MGYRIPMFTTQKFGEFLTGMVKRWFNILVYDEVGLRWSGSSGSRLSAWRKHLSFLAMRGLLLAEFWFAIRCKRGGLWFSQFVLTLWLNMFMIVSSHDFDEIRESEGHRNADWGVFQVKHSLDMHITGIPWIDIFLTAGLGCHRVHHVLPYQRSGFANIVSVKAVQDTCKIHNVSWEPSRSFFRQRLIPVMSYYLGAPAQLPDSTCMKVRKGPGLGGFIMEHLDPACVWTCVCFVLAGFSGHSI